jgi:general secretion pathway protein D
MGMNTGETTPFRSRQSPGGRVARASAARLAGILLQVVAVLCAGVTNPVAARSVTLNLQDAELSTLIATVSEATRKNFVVDPRVKAKVTIISATPLADEELYQTFLSILQVHGFIAIPSGNVIKIVPDTNGRAGAPPDSSGNAGDDLITRVVKLRNVRADQLVPVLRPMVPQQSHVSANVASNVLIISDRAANVERLVRIIQRVDVPGEVEIEVFALKHASAVEVARILNHLNTRPGAEALPARLVADSRTNSVLISGDPASRMRMRAVVTHLDTPLETDSNTKVIYLHYASAKDIAPILEGISATLDAGSGQAPEAGNEKTQTSIQVDEQTNAIILTASPAVVRSLRGVLRQLDVRRAQVLVEAVIAEISNDRLGEFGIQWRTTTDTNDTGVFGGTNFGSGASSISQFSANPFSPASGLSLGVIKGAISFGGQQFLNVAALVRALAADTTTNILSTPSLVTLDNQAAEIVIAQNVPFLTGQFVNTGAANTAVNPFQTIQRADVGLILRVRPQINEGNALKLDIEQEVSNLVPNGAASSASAQGAVDLITNRRFLKTTVMVDDGQMLVLGGLLSDDVEQSEEKVPLLGDLPVLGAIFRYQRATKTKRNLMVFLRPVILRDERGETISSAKYNFMRAEQVERREVGDRQLLSQPAPVLPTLEEYRAAPGMVPEGHVDDSSKGSAPVD